MKLSYDLGIYWCTGNGLLYCDRCISPGFVINTIKPVAPRRYVTRVLDYLQNLIETCLLSFKLLGCFFLLVWSSSVVLRAEDIDARLSSTPCSQFCCGFAEHKSVVVIVS